VVVCLRNHTDAGASLPTYNFRVINYSSNEVPPMCSGLVRIHVFGIDLRVGVLVTASFQHSHAIITENLTHIFYLEMSK